MTVHPTQHTREKIMWLYDGPEWAGYDYPIPTDCTSPKDETK